MRCSKEVVRNERILEATIEERENSHSRRKTSTSGVLWYGELKRRENFFHPIHFYNAGVTSGQRRTTAG